jgi:hypothetical protein
MIDMNQWYYDIENFCIQYWRETFGHSIFCFDNTLIDLDFFLEEDEMLQFTTYINDTFGTKLSTKQHADIPLYYLYKQILEKAIESFDGQKDIFHEEYSKKLQEWNIE